ncbi:hypothetical protein PM082_004389 [Marasmius tenuissimus]|nr:hypothetical protein PM082_004389 [Marasmius tenuissimus]
MLLVVNTSSMFGTTGIGNSAMIRENEFRVQEVASVSWKVQAQDNSAQGFLKLLGLLRYVDLPIFRTTEFCSYQICQVTKAQVSGGKSVSLPALNKTRGPQSIGLRQNRL